MIAAMSTVTTPVLVARALARGYGEVRALDGVNVDLAAGEAVALLGPNGAGKTTLLTILAGVTRSDGGSVTWAEAPTRAWAGCRSGPRCTPACRCARTCACSPRSRRPAPRTRSPRSSSPAPTWRSTPTARPPRCRPGTLQRLNLAIALAGRPSVLLLDEPTATLSPDQRLRLWAWLDGLRGTGMALMFSTQSVDEAVRRGDRLLVLAAGRRLFAGTAAEMAAAHGGGGDDAEAAERAFMRLVSGRREDDAR